MRRLKSGEIERKNAIKIVEWMGKQLQLQWQRIRKIIVRVSCKSVWRLANAFVCK